MHRMRFVFMIICVWIFSVTVYANPKIIFKRITNPTQTYGVKEIPAPIRVYLEQLLEENKILYGVNVYEFDHYYLIYLLSGNTWGIDKIRVIVDGQGKIRTIEKNFQGLPFQMAKFSRDLPIVCPDEQVEFVAISAYPGVGKVNEAMQIVSKAASKRYKTMTIVTPNADAQVYKNWFACANLKGFYTIGHGSNEEILVGNGEVITYYYFNGAEHNNKFEHTTLVINSCQVFNNPLGSQITFGNSLTASDFDKNPSLHPYQYMGGYINLLMQSSEMSSACFIEKALSGAKMDYATLKSCAAPYDFHYQSFAIAYPEKYFFKA